MRRAGAVLLVAMLPMLPVSGDHVQEEQGFAVSFDHKTGNEWWVEVIVGGDVGGVRAMDTGGPWVELEKKSWGAWAASFHVEPGHDVRFEAVQAGTGAPVQSCWFTHPEGMERCDAEATVFDHEGGNEWWVQAEVTGSPSRVQAMDTDGPWVELEKKSWGDWAASFHIEPGHDVRFRAMVDGAWQTSCWFTHPDGVTPTGGQACGATADEPPPPTGAFDAQFHPKPGNEWWVEVVVEANEPLAGVDARDDGGPWVALEKKSWGAWARSFHVQDGSIVEFRAQSTGGDADISGGYRWPEATPVGEEPPASDVDVAFGPRAGNAWWIETYVVVNATVTGVEARADGGAWNTLTLRDWGTWAGSFHAPAGSVVDFRATTDDGRDISDGFVWPGATFVGGDGSWPEEGSYVRYTTSGSDPVSRSDGTRTQIFHDGQWWARSERVVTSDSFSTQHETGFCDDAFLPHGPLPVTGGDRVDVVVGECHNGTMDVVVEGQDTHATHREGDPAKMETWRATRTDDCDCQSWTAEWDRSNGLLALSHFAGSRSSSVQDLEDTDAPMRT